MNEDVQDLLSQGLDLMSAARYEDALELYGKVLALDKGNYDAYLNRGTAYINLQRFDEGIEDFKKALMAKPNDGDALYSLGCAYFVADKQVDAVKAFNHCEELGLATSEMYEILETIFIDADDPVQAIRYANKAIQLNPLDATHYVNKAQFQLLREQSKEAVATLREVEDLLPDSGEPYLIEAQIFTQLEDYDAALASVERALKRFPEDPSMLLAKGTVLNQAERPDEALPALRSAKSLAGDNDALAKDVDVQMAVAFAQKQNPEASVDALEAAVAHGGDDVDEAYFMLLTELAAVGRYEDLTRHTRAALKLDGLGDQARAAAIFWNAYGSHELGRDDAEALLHDAVRDLRRITIQNPGLIEAYCYRLQCHKLLGEYDRALDLAKHLVHVAPDDASGYAFMSDVLAAKGDDKAAQEWREKALSLDSDFKF